MLPPPMNVTFTSRPSCVRRRSRCRRAPPSRPRRSRARDPPTCPSTACRRQAPPRDSVRSRRASARNCARSRADVGGGLRNAHDAAQAQIRQCCDVSRKRERRRRATPLLRRLPADVHLDEHVERPPRRRRAADSRSAICGAVDRFHPVEGRRRGARLVALQRPDQVPRHVGEIGERGPLVDRFLHVVLAERALARGVHRAHGGAGKVFETASSRTEPRRPIRGARRILDAPARGLPRFLVRAHNRPRIRHRYLARVLHTTVRLSTDPSSDDTFAMMKTAKNRRNAVALRSCSARFTETRSRPLTAASIKSARRGAIRDA